MRKSFAVLRSLLWTALLAAGQVACSASDAPSSSNAGAGSAGTPSAAGSAGSTSAGAPSVGAGAGGQASGGAPSVAGSGGTAGSSAGSAGVAGAGVSGGGGAAPFGAIACTPTGAGDGKHDLVGGEGGPAPAEWTLKAGVTAGTVTAMASFASMSYMTDSVQPKVLHFPYWIYTSANYVKGSPAILLLMGDGNQFLTQFHFPTVLDNLTAAGDLPPTVAVFVDPPTDGMRVDTYDPPTDTYTKFLFDELLPQVVFKNYSVSRDPNAFAEVGYSASGGQGWKVLWNKPNDIHKFIGFNSSFGAANVKPYNVDWVKVVNMDPARPALRVTLLTSIKDIGAPQGDADPRGDWQAINTNMATAIGAKGGQWRLMNGMGHHYEPVDGEHDLPNALRWTFQGCKF